MSREMNQRLKTKSEGLALVRYINLSMGDDVTALVGNGTSGPYRIVWTDGDRCEVVKGMTDWYNITAMLRFANGRTDS